MSKVKGLISSLLVAYIGFLIIATVFQRSLIYHPKSQETYSSEWLTKHHAITIENENLKWIFAPSYTPTNRVLVYFHGNAGSASDRIYKSRPWRNNGFDVMLVEYPAYGVNRGEISEEAFYQAGRLVIDKTKMLFPKSKLYLYGESIGSGTATQMATEYDEVALILESPFTSLMDVVKNKLPFIPSGLLLWDRYENDMKINEINSSLYILHGENDEVVPYDLGRTLYEIYDGDKKFFSIDNASHNNIYMHVDMDKIIQQIVTRPRP